AVGCGGQGSPSGRGRLSRPQFWGGGKKEAVPAARCWAYKSSDQATPYVPLVEEPPCAGSTPSPGCSRYATACASARPRPSPPSSPPPCAASASASPTSAAA